MARLGPTATALLLTAAIGCAPASERGGAADDGTSPMNQVAESYVQLVLAVGQHDPAYVDAYYGPPEWKAEAERGKRSLADIDKEAASLISRVPVPTASGVGGDDLETLRQQYLRRQLEAMRARIRMLSGETLTFDEESQALYDAIAPTHPERYFEEILAGLETKLAGRGPVSDRLEQYRSRFVIPKDRLGAVFDVAIAECRRRTMRHVSLPDGESFTVEYVTGKSWSAYNWYQGNYKSLIQVNTDLPIYIDRAVDLACHEGYPGHHVYNALLEQELMRKRGWIETSVYALFSPQSLIAEGTANYGIDVAFPGDERIAFERDVLFPAAGLDPALAAEYYAIQTVVEKLSYAGNEAARRYLNGEIDRAAAAAWLTRFALMSPARAEQRTRFFDEYRSYVINYNLGEDMVRAFIDRRVGAQGTADDRWQEFARLLGSPRLPSGLR
jgi:hypothetical protein